MLGKMFNRMESHELYESQVGLFCNMDPRTGTAAVERLMNVKQHCLSFPGFSRASQLISTSHVQRGIFHVEVGYNMFVDHLLIGMHP